MRKVRKGFSLLESLVSFTILIILALMVYTNVATSFRKDDFRDYRTLIDRDNRYEMSRAISNTVARDALNISTEYTLNDKGFYLTDDSYVVNLNNYKLTFGSTDVSFDYLSSIDDAKVYTVSVPVDSQSTVKKDIDAPVFQLADRYVYGPFSIKAQSTADYLSKIVYEYSPSYNDFTIHKRYIDSHETVIPMYYGHANASFVSLFKLAKSTNTFSRNYTVEIKRR